MWANPPLLCLLFCLLSDQRVVLLLRLRLCHRDRLLALPVHSITTTKWAAGGDNSATLLILSSHVAIWKALFFALFALLRRSQWILLLQLAGLVGSFWLPIRVFASLLVRRAIPICTLRFIQPIVGRCLSMKRCCSDLVVPLNIHTTPERTPSLLLVDATTNYQWPTVIAVLHEVLNYFYVYVCFYLLS